MKIREHWRADELADRAIDPGLNEKEALAIATAADHELPALFAGADHLRRLRFGDAVHLCSVVNAKSGRCDQDCAFCAQSAHHAAATRTYDFLPRERVVDAAKRAVSNGAGGFSVVTSGRALPRQDLEQATASIRAVSGIPGVYPCASLGILSQDELSELKQAGLVRYHHNLETAASFYPSICSTRPFDENVQCVRDARAAGLETCCGGVFGLGETPAQRVELAFQIKALDPDSVPINFLNPIPGTPLEGRRELRPLDCLRIIALFRYALPRAHIPICGGREVNLRHLQSMIFLAGASGMMIGGYLTTAGRDPREDLAMIADLGLVPVREGSTGAGSTRDKP